MSTSRTHRRLIVSMQNIVLLVALMFGHSAGASLVIQYDANGFIDGASGVVVGGNEFSVEFRSGNCVEAFDGCVNGALAFSTFDQAKEAAQALVDQLFPLFLEPTQMSGCYLTTVCNVLTPYSIAVNSAVSRKFGSFLDLDDTVTGPASLPPSTTIGVIGSEPGRIYARWTQTTVVPLPAAAWLLLSGLAGLGVLGRRHKAA